MEGVNHGRDGSLSLIQMTAGPESKGKNIFLFDITILGRTAFEEGGLRSILEDQSVQKVLFDVRGDADSLAHNYQVRMRNIYDIQVMYAFRFSEATDNFLKSLNIVLEKLPINLLSTAERQRLHRLKNEATNLFTTDRQIWDKRPLCRTLVDYTASGVMQLLCMKTLWGEMGCMSEYEYNNCEHQVQITSEEREREFVTRRVQIQGRAKAQRDFSLERSGLIPPIPDNFCGNVESNDDVGPIGVYDICDYDSDSGLCEY